MVLALALIIVYAESCNEANWCKSAPGSKKNKDGTENSGCSHWYKDCPCECAETAVKMAAKEAETQAIADAATVAAELINHKIANAFKIGSGTELKISLVVRSQAIPRDIALAKRLRERAREAGGEIELHFVHELPHTQQMGGAWNLKLVLPKIFNSAGVHDWLLCIDPVTDVDFVALRKLLSAFDPAEVHLLGRGLTMKQFTIRTLSHDFADLQFAYLPSGVAFSKAAMQKVALKQTTKADFMVYHDYEFGHFLRKELGLVLHSLPHFCVAGEKGGGARGASGAEHKCVTTAIKQSVAEKAAGVVSDLKPSEVLIGVKTCAIFHESRLSVIKETWGEAAETAGVGLVYLSDAADTSPVTTVDLTREWGEVVNQKKGHCAKCHAILKHFHKHHRKEGRKWFVIADDDTIFSIQALMHVLATLDPEEEVYLGERYPHPFWALSCTHLLHALTYSMHSPTPCTHLLHALAIHALCAYAHANIRSW